MAQDVIELIIDDHRRFEDLLREVRNIEADRASSLSELSAILVAHAEAEEREVYPQLRHRADEVTGEDVEHGSEEHAEWHAAPLNVLEIDDPDADEFGAAVEELTKALAHHLDEEERTILNPAREKASGEVRERLGAAPARFWLWAHRKRAPPRRGVISCRVLTLVVSLFA